MKDKNIYPATFALKRFSEAGGLKKHMKNHQIIKSSKSINYLVLFSKPVTSHHLT